MQSQLQEDERGEVEAKNKQAIVFFDMYITYLSKWYTRRSVTMLGNWKFRYFLIKILNEVNLILKPS